MNINPINNLREMTPDEGLWLYKENSGSPTKLVYLGIEENENEWIEITDEQKAEIETQQKSEILTDIELKAQAYDIITGGAE